MKFGSKECKMSECSKAIWHSFVGALAAILLVMLIASLSRGMHMGKKMSDRDDYGMRKGMPMMSEMHKMGGMMMLEKLGMSQEELQVELDAGKTMQQIAEEKGIELPCMIEGGSSCPMKMSKDQE